MDGIVLQQSWPWFPCDEQGIELQHCIACSGVVVAPQSKAYVESPTASSARKIGLINRIIDQASPPRVLESSAWPQNTRGQHGSRDSCR